MTRLSKDTPWRRWKRMLLFYAVVLGMTALACLLTLVLCGRHP